MLLGLLLALLLVPSVPGKRGREERRGEQRRLEREQLEEERKRQEEQDEYAEYEYEYQQQERQAELNRRMQDDKGGSKLRRNKLVVIVIDGFRWDYFDKYHEKTGGELTGFQKFMDSGVRAQYLESVFPAESFPAWQTIQTGLYPESHGIVGNQFYDREVHEQMSKKNQHTSFYAFFNIEDERTTSNQKWWQKEDVEPIWATGARHDVPFATFLWGRCDIAYEDVKRLRPSYCENYYSKDRTKTLRINIDKALNQLQTGVDAAIIYEETLAKSAEEFGPLSNQTMRKLRELDQAMEQLESRLMVTHMKDFVNVVVLSDHGMTHGHHTAHSLFDPESEEVINKVQLSKYLQKNEFRWIVGSGSHAGVYPRDPSFRKTIVEALNAVPGLRAFKRSDIPEEYHYRRSANSPPVLVIAEKGTVILASGSEVQRPTFHGPSPGNGYNAQRLLDQTKMGLSGYEPTMEDMRGIFLAQGPDFKNNGEEVAYMKLVDVYQVLAYVLKIPTNPHNGTWSHVRGLLLGEPGSATSSQAGAFLLTLAVAASIALGLRH